MEYEREQILIDIIQHYPCLFDKSLQDYKDNNKKTNAWEAIASAMSCTVEELQKLWKNLRERYGKEKRSTKWTPSGSEAPESVWPLYNAMKFMEKHVVSRKRVTNVPRPSSGQSNVSTPRSSPLSSPRGGTAQPWDTISVIVEHTDTEDEEQIQKDMQLDPPPSKKVCDQQPSTSKIVGRAKGKTIDAGHLKIEDTLSYLTDYLKNKQTPDKNVAFGQYVGLSLAEMPEDEQNFKKIKIMEVLGEKFSK